MAVSRQYGSSRDLRTSLAERPGCDVCEQDILSMGRFVAAHPFPDRGLVWLALGWTCAYLPGTSRDMERQFGVSYLRQTRVRDERSEP